MTNRQLQDHQSIYLDLFAEFRKEDQAEKESINDDVVFEIEPIKQVEVDVDYVLMLARQYLDENGPGEDKEIQAAIDRAVDSSPSLRSRRDLVEQFIESLTAGADVDDEWPAFIEAKRFAELDEIIADKGLKPGETKAFVDQAFRDGAIATAGTAVTRILLPVSRFADGNGRATKKQSVLARLSKFLDRYLGLTS